MSSYSLFPIRCGEAAMQLWTYHRSNFPVDTISEIDSTKSFWWTYDEPSFRYREVLPVLWKLVGTKDFLWCCTERGGFMRMTEEDDVVEWELNVPATSVLFYRELLWDEILHGKSDNWSDLILKDVTDPLPGRTGAIVRVPLPPNSATNLGPAPVKYPKVRPKWRKERIR
jgi:hypothetical protein